MKHNDNDVPVTNMIGLLIVILLVVLWAIWTG